MINEKKYWQLIQDAQWKLDHSYKRISNEWKTLPDEEFEMLKKFIDKKAGDLDKKYHDAWLGNDGGDGFDVSDDGWSDLRYEVVGRGEEFYNSITVEKLRQMAEDFDYHESFGYCVLK